MRDADQRAEPPDVPDRIAPALREAAGALQAISDTPRLDAELLMADALGVARSELLLRHLQDRVPAGFAQRVARRSTGEPVAYILGEQEFFGLSFEVGPAVLIPRADSETLVCAALAIEPPARRVLDCGTGSGVLLLAVLANLPAAQGVGFDRSEAALAIARRNAERLGLSDRTRFVTADWETPGWRDGLGECFDLILANPPYVEAGAALSPSVSGFEPHGALFAGPDGLDAYARLIPQLSGLLREGGRALVEIGSAQAEPVAAIAARAGFARRLLHDLGGRPRALELSL